MPVAVSKPESAPTPIATGSKPQLLYRCLLNQHAQKMRKSFPIYQTRNEGSDHLPKFRSTVSFDGVSYTSSNTFSNLKMAEMDVSKIAYIAMIQKSKSEALCHIQEDKCIYKSIVIEFSVKMNLERPKYVTSNQGGAIPVFSSQLSFNGATFPGDIAKSKKEAEQLVARAVILKYLDSEFANDMAEVINCKFRHAAEISKLQEISNAYNGTTVVVTQPQAPKAPTRPTTPATPVVAQTCIAEVPTQPTCLVPPVVTQPCMIEPVTPAVPVVTQPQTAKVMTEPLTPADMVVVQPPTPKVLTKPITPAAHVVTHPLIPKTEPITSTAHVVTQPRIPKVEPITHPIATMVTHPHIPKIEPITPLTVTMLTHPRIPKIEPITPLTATMLTHPRIPKLSTESVSKTIPVVTQQRQEGIRPAVRRSEVLAPIPSAQVNMVASAQHSGKWASSTSLDHSVEHKPLTTVCRPVVFAQTPSAQVSMVASAPSSGQLTSNLSMDCSEEHKRLTLRTPGKKRYWEDNKNAQKRMRVDTQRPVPGMHTSPSQPFRLQSSRSKWNKIRTPHKNASRH